MQQQQGIDVANMHFIALMKTLCYNEASIQKFPYKEIAIYYTLGDDSDQETARNLALGCIKSAIKNDLMTILGQEAKDKLPVIELAAQKFFADFSNILRKCFDELNGRPTILI